MTTRPWILAGITILALAAAGAGIAQQHPLAQRWFERHQQAVTELGLNPTQQQQLETLLGNQRAFRRAAHAEVGALLDNAETELRSADGDVAQIAAEFDRSMLALMTEARQLRAERMAFYDSLTPAQQASARQMLADRLQRAKRLHAVVGDWLSNAP